MQTAETVRDEDLLTLRSVMAKTGAGRSRIYAEIKAGRFPAPRRVWGRSLWVRSEVQAWVDRVVATAPRVGKGVGRPQADTKKPL